MHNVEAKKQNETCQLIEIVEEIKSEERKETLDLTSCMDEEIEKQVEEQERKETLDITSCMDEEIEKQVEEKEAQNLKSYDNSANDDDELNSNDTGNYFLFILFIY